MSTDGLNFDNSPQLSTNLEVTSPQVIADEPQPMQVTTPEPLQQSAPANDVQRALELGFSEAAAAKLAELSPEDYEAIVGQRQQQAPYPQMPGPFGQQPPGYFPPYAMPGQQMQVPYQQYGYPPMPQQAAPAQQDVPLKINLEPDMSNAEAELNRVLGAVNQQVEQLRQAQQNQLLYQFMAEQQQTSGWVGDQLASLGDEWADVFGKGRHGGQPWQQHNRQRIQAEVDQTLNQYYPAQPRTPDLLKSAFDFVLYRNYGPRQPRRSAQAPAQRPQQVLNRPTTTSLQNIRGLTGRQGVQKMQDLINQMERENVG